MTQQNSKSLNFSNYNKVKGVYYLSKIDDEFEQLYIEARKQEERILSDKQVRRLPYTDKSFKLHKEWNLRKKTSDRFLAYLKRNRFKTILDVGCGNGWFTNLLSESNGDTKVVGVDINATELEQAARVFESSKVSFLYCDIYERNVMFEDCFDLITLNASVQYFSDLGRLIKRLNEFLKPNGEIHILDSPFYKKEEVDSAKKRTTKYYRNLGNEKLSDFYFHHSYKNIEGFDVLYKPTNSFIKLFDIKKGSPFLWLKQVKRHQSSSIDKGFSQIAKDYEGLDKTSSLVNYMREVVRNHLSNRISNKETILEINCGTGLDALHFAKQGNHVLATDIANGMIEQVKLKISQHNLEDNLSCQKLSYKDLGNFNEKSFSCIFSNFGGLNCVDNQTLNQVITDTSKILKPNGIITLVIMPRITFYEWFRVFKGNKSAFRRLKKGGVLANVKGEKILTFYHSVRSIKKMLASDYTNVQVENIFTFGPSGSSYQFPEKHNRLFRTLTNVDRISNRIGLFKGLGDYYIISAERK